MIDPQDFHFQFSMMQPMKENCEKVKRPLNAYNLFFIEQQPIIRNQQPNLTGNEVSKELGRRWKEMDEASRRPYIEEARSIQERFRSENPDYHYEKSKSKKGKTKSRQRNQSMQPEQNLLNDIPTAGSHITNVFSMVMASSVGFMITPIVMQHPEMLEEISRTLKSTDDIILPQLFDDTNDVIRRAFLCIADGLEEVH